MDLEKFKGVIRIIREKFEADTDLRSKAFADAVVNYAENKEMNVEELDKFADYVIALYPDSTELEMVLTAVITFIRADANRVNI